MSENKTLREELLPIESAPKDGRPIVGYADGKYAVVEWYTCPTSAYWSLTVCGAYAEDSEWMPTHWMPLHPPVDLDVYHDRAYGNGYRAGWNGCMMNDNDQLAKWQALATARPSSTRADTPSSLSAPDTERRQEAIRELEEALRYHENLKDSYMTMVSLGTIRAALSALKDKVLIPYIGEVSG